jgi:hypothetical protein
MFKFDKDDLLSMLTKMTPRPTPHDLEVAKEVADSMDDGHIDIVEELDQLRQRMCLLRDRARGVMDSIMKPGGVPETEVVEAFDNAGILAETREHAKMLRTLEFIQLARQHRN